MKMRSLLVGALTVLTTLAFAADKDVEDLLAHMRDAYKAVKTAKLSVDVVSHDPEGDRESKLSIDLTYKAEKKVHFEARPEDDPDDRLVATWANDKIMLKVSGEDHTMDGDESVFDQVMGPLGNLEAVCFWEWKKQLSTDEGANMHDSTFVLTPKTTWNDKEYILLEEHATQGDDFKIVVQYYIDPKTYMIWRTVVNDADNNMLEDHKVTSLELNPQVDDSVFDIS